MSCRKESTHPAVGCPHPTVRLAAISFLVGLVACAEATDGTLGPEHPPVAAAKGGVKGAPGGGGGSATVELAIGVTTAGAQDAVVVTDNTKKLELQDPATDDGTRTFSDAFDLANTHAAGLANCSTSGVFDEGLTPQDLLDLMLDGARVRNFTLRIDKTAAEAGTLSDAQELKHGWSEGIPSGRIQAWIGARSKKGEPPALVTIVSVVGNTTTYRFHAGNGRVVLSQLSGTPKEHPGLKCALLDDVDVTVTLN